MRHHLSPDHGTAKEVGDSHPEGSECMWRPRGLSLHRGSREESK